MAAKVDLCFVITSGQNQYHALIILPFFPATSQGRFLPTNLCFPSRKQIFQTPVRPEDPTEVLCWMGTKAVSLPFPNNSIPPQSAPQMPDIFLLFFFPSHLHLLYLHLPLELSSFLLVPSDSLVFTSLSFSLELYCKFMGNLLFAHQLLQCTPAQQVFTHILKFPTDLFFLLVQFHGSINKLILKGAALNRNPKPKILTNDL